MTPTDQSEASAGALGAGPRITEARRAAGLTQADLAERLGTPLWVVDRLERGLRDPAAHAEELAHATGWPAQAFLPTRPAVRQAPDPEELAEGRAAGGGQHVIAAGLVLLLCVRFFSEKVTILPKSVTFVDVPIFFALMLALMGARRALLPAERHGYAALAVGFLAWATLSTLVNLDRVAIGPVLLFVYGFLAPIGVYYAVYAIWPAGNARFLTRVLVGLGALQVAIGVVYDFPRFLSTDNPDVMSGTFGENGYQMAIFLLVTITVSAASFVYDKGSLSARLSVPLIVGMAGMIFLVQYRALLFTIVLTAILVAMLMSGGRARGVLAAIVMLAALVAVFDYVASRYQVLKYEGAVTSVRDNPMLYVEARAELLEDVADLYAERPNFLLTGTGPGTFSSRAWRTFADVRETRTAVAAGFARRLNNGQAYTTDVSTRYTIPRIRRKEVIEGSRAATQPFASWSALPAEVGLPGVLMMAAMYILALLQALRLSVRSLAQRLAHDPVIPILLGAFTAFCVLIQVSVLENWLETTRITFCAWMLLAVGTKEFNARADRAHDDR